MGVDGFFKSAKDAEKHIYLGAYKGKKVAVDASCWLHKAVYICSYELIAQKPTSKHIDFCMKNTQLLMDFGIQPVLVFDGQPLPLKAATNAERRALRIRALKEATELIRTKKKFTREDYKVFSKAVEVTPEMSRSFQLKLEAKGVPFVVAPYEADSQLGFLNDCGDVDAVLSEDSDLFAHGCKVLLCKMQSDGKCVEITWERLRETESLMPGASKHPISRHIFVKGCILAGCDYLKSIEGIGIKKAFLNLSRTFPPGDIQSLLHSIQLQKFRIPANYKENFEAAEQGFYCQPVYDKQQGKIVRALSIPGSQENIDEKDLAVVGETLSLEVGRNLCQGKLNPRTLEKWQNHDEVNRKDSPTGKNVSGVSKTKNVVSTWLKKTSVKSRPVNQPTLAKMLPSNQTNKEESKQTVPITIATKRRSGATGAETASQWLQKMSPNPNTRSPVSRPSQSKVELNLTPSLAYTHGASFVRKRKRFSTKIETPLASSTPQLISGDVQSPHLILKRRLIGDKQDSDFITDKTENEENIDNNENKKNSEISEFRMSLGAFAYRKQKLR